MGMTRRARKQLGSSRCRSTRDGRSHRMRRRIDNNWIAEAENLAIQLDSLTNNSSLALAIEVGSAKRVILLAADAQVGNWLSWHEDTWECSSGNGSTTTVKAED